ncbi:hypothetical protein A4G19_15835 [Pasteurellaceae bacterium Macca]|nr:hypothetical protein [Pasteurellaceae bacterium Macca]MCK3656261.1 hypothetical protein [Pasteurellaceae bacterium Macca]MCK3656504.1 hypothetical protein [Pasteurellaceae bacterium Macca]MCK3656727.1 hypothetical protein [Pasteurellaceae bacterium Macca]MCK3657126.1 hypothetical protein [Pasteurellaceae bacterium Macca]
MKITRKNIQLKQGGDISLVVKLRQRNEEGVEIPFDLTQVERLDLHAVSRGERVLALSSVAQNIEISDREQGVLVLHFSARSTQEAGWLEAEYDLQMMIAGKVRTVLEGAIQLSPDVTRL